MGAITGIDVSQHQGELDWGAARGAGYSFAYIKATEGVGYVSPTLDSQLKGARDAGFLTGLYHFARPDTNSPQQDAADFAAQLRRLGSAGPGNLAPCLDVEKSADNLGGWVKGFIDALRGEIGRQEIVVYASANWLSGELATDSWVDPAVYLWVAHYGCDPGKPGYLTDRVALHQHTSEGEVPGVSGHVDLNVALLDIAVLTGGAAPPPPPPAEVYVVQPGDTLSAIAARLGVAWQDIARVNGIADPDRIQVGQELRIPR